MRGSEKVQRLYKVKDVITKLIKEQTHFNETFMPFKMLSSLSAFKGRVQIRFYLKTHLNRTSRCLTTKSARASVQSKKARILTSHCIAKSSLSLGTCSLKTRSEKEQLCEARAIILKPV